MCSCALPQSQPLVFLIPKNSPKMRRSSAFYLKKRYKNNVFSSGGKRVQQRDAGKIQSVGKALKYYFIQHRVCNRWTGMCKSLAAMRAEYKYGNYTRIVRYSTSSSPCRKIDFRFGGSARKYKN